MLVVMGLNHTTADVSLREKVAFDSERLFEQLPLFVSQLAQFKIDATSLVILSTCNRTEIYLETDSFSNEKLLLWLQETRQIEPEALKGHYYQYVDDRMLAHLIAVMSGIDSMVIGETQIAKQIKSAYSMSLQANCLSPHLDQLFQYAFTVAKKIRSQTAIGANPVSVASTAVNFANRVFKDLTTKSALLIGSGETISLIATHLSSKGVGHIFIANRSLERAAKLAIQFKAEPVLLADITDYLHRADVIATATASQLPILGKGAIEQALKKRKHRPIYIIDLAIPRDVEPQVSELDDVYLYNIDNLRQIADENIRIRQDSAVKGKQMIEEAVLGWEQKQQELEAIDSVREYRQLALNMCTQELQKALQELDSNRAPNEILERLAYNLTNKLIHAPTEGLKQAALIEEDNLLQWSEQLLGLKPLDNSRKQRRK